MHCRSGAKKDPLLDPPHSIKKRHAPRYILGRLAWSPPKGSRFSGLNFFLSKTGQHFRTSMPVLTKRVKGLVQQGLLKLSGSKFWGVTDGPGFYQHRPKRFLLFLLSVSSSALFVSVWACGGGFRFMFVFAIVFHCSFCISVVRWFLLRFTFASPQRTYSLCFLFHRLFFVFSFLYR